MGTLIFLELSKALSKLKKGKALGVDAVTNEFLVWAFAIINMIFKKGDVLGDMWRLPANLFRLYVPRDEVIHSNVDWVIAVLC